MIRSAAIQGARDGEFATEAMLELAEELPDHYGTLVVGCFTTPVSSGY